MKQKKYLPLLLVPLLLGGVLILINLSSEKKAQKPKDSQTDCDYKRTPGYCALKDSITEFKKKSWNSYGYDLMVKKLDDYQALNKIKPEQHKELKKLLVKNYLQVLDRAVDEHCKTTPSFSENRDGIFRAEFNRLEIEQSDRKVLTSNLDKLSNLQSAFSIGQKVKNYLSFSQYNSTTTSRYREQIKGFRSMFYLKSNNAINAILDKATSELIAFESWYNDNIDLLRDITQLETNYKKGILTQAAIEKLFEIPINGNKIKNKGYIKY